MTMAMIDYVPATFASWWGAKKRSIDSEKKRVWWIKRVPVYDDGRVKKVWGICEMRLVRRADDSHEYEVWVERLIWPRARGWHQLVGTPFGVKWGRFLHLRAQHRLARRTLRQCPALKHELSWKR